MNRHKWNCEARIVFRFGSLVQVLFCCFVFSAQLITKFCRVLRPPKSSTEQTSLLLTSSGVSTMLLIELAQLISFLHRKYFTRSWIFTLFSPTTGVQHKLLNCSAISQFILPIHSEKPLVVFEKSERTKSHSGYCTGSVCSAATAKGVKRNELLCSCRASCLVLRLHQASATIAV